eukprot:scaffold27952_cov16-Tisochrysis_lutea.AAC.2
MDCQPTSQQARASSGQVHPNVTSQAQSCHKPSKTPAQYTQHCMQGYITYTHMHTQDTAGKCWPGRAIYAHCKQESKLLSTVQLRVVSEN